MALVDLIRAGELCTPDLCTVRAHRGRLRALTMQCFPQQISFCMAGWHGRAGRVTAQNGGSRREQGPKSRSAARTATRRSSMLKQWLSQQATTARLAMDVDAILTPPCIFA